MRYVKAFGRFWYDFIVGEDWRIAAGVAVTLAAGALLAYAGAVNDALLVVLVAASIVMVVVASVLGTALGGAALRSREGPRPRCGTMPARDRAGSRG